MTARLRSICFVAVLAIAATVAYNARIKHEMVDFVTWRQAVVRAIDAEPLYRAEDGHYLFKYLPAFALLMTPFGWLDVDTGKAVWFAVEVGLLVALLWWSIAALPARRRPKITLALFAVALMAKFYAHELVLGQTNLPLAVLMLVGAMLGAQRARLALSGALIGLAVFVKPYALILILWLLATAPWSSVAAAVAVFGIGLLLPSVVYGWSGNLSLLSDWSTTVLTSTTENLLNNDNVSIAAMWAKWIHPGPLASVCAALTIAALAVVAIDVVRRRETVAEPAYLEVALLMLLVPLVSPQGWDYVLLLATPAVVVVVDRWRELTPPWQWALGTALALMGLTMFDLMGRALYGRFMALSVVSVCALVITAGLVRLRSDRLA